MQEKSLRIYNTDKTFFAKIGTALTKLFMPTSIGINSLLISMKRSSMLKNYQMMLDTQKDGQHVQKSQTYEQKFEDSYALYLDSIDQHIMDSIYKKVKNEQATDFEKEALSKYYLVVHIKEDDEIEYKYKKQQYLLSLDYEQVKNSSKEKVKQLYKQLYCYEMEKLYKGLLKHYSIKLSERLDPAQKDNVYRNIFVTLEEYVTNILPIKIDKEEISKETIEDYNKFERFEVGKLDQNDVIEKNMILLGISRRLFTHSLPLIVAEQCYIKLLKDARSLIVDTKIPRKRQKAYSLLLSIMEEYNVRLLSTKIYWDKPAQKDAYKKFYAKYKENETIKEANPKQYEIKRQILFIREDLQSLYQNENKYFKIIKFYKNKLVELKDMRNLPNRCHTVDKKYSKIKAKNKTRKARIIDETAC